ncbi:PREDICTED: uncharacterized protein LOC109205806 [Nicotiana attenuata]|uniref:uncharacterized protein LOC109205806 n=1 Tax=Nicotiana attenuata TaxID=49451 RepID=UPI000905157C|nr:PREDICTED: uncharacterized protein LOC109205806 [Nicotiana attenuata]
MVCISTVAYSVIINVKPTKPFEARKGLRQGDPLSPLLFVMAMEYLCTLLKPLKENKDFKFHPKCAKVNLVQLRFADDLLLFCKGDIKSVKILHKQFQTFSAASGLIANPNKSSIYFGGVDNRTQQHIMNMLGYTKEKLPFMYLGVPLSTKRLTAMQCEPLIDRMLNRIQCWTTRFLSYAGRAMLIKSLLRAIQTFWAQIFVLPKKIIQFIETICRRFLWSGSAEPTKKTLIAWDKFYMQALWNICTKKEKLWVQWIHAYYIKGGTIWNTEPKSASWVIQKIIKAKRHFEDAGYTEVEVTKIEKFSVKDMHKSMQGEFQKESWRKLVCNNHGLPKWIFILSLAIQDKLATKERLARWGTIEDKTCSLCQRENETVQHLFFDWEMPATLWQTLLHWQGIKRTKNDWQEELKWIERVAKGKSAGAAICRMVLAAAVYHIWQA